MSTLVGRYRCDHATGTACITQPPEWFATEREAQRRADELTRAGHSRVVVWFWPSEYHETPAEEGARMVREALQERFGWLRGVA